jgi:hypothetical protein
VLRVGSHLGGRQVAQEDRVADGLRPWCNGIAVAYIYLQGYAGTILLGLNFNSHTAITRCLADDGALNRGRVEHETVFRRDLADFTECSHPSVDIVRAKAQQVDVACRAVGRSNQSENSRAPLSR